MIPLWLIMIFNIIYWPIIQISIASWVLKMPWQKWNPDSSIYKSLPWESDTLYRALKVRQWKRHLPDGAQWLGFDFKKEGSGLRNPVKVQRFLAETCRSECCHFLSLAFSPIPFLWNPSWAGWIMLAYGVLSNLPCMIAQRYNRRVLMRIRNQLRQKTI